MVHIQIEWVLVVSWGCVWELVTWSMQMSALCPRMERSTGKDTRLASGLPRDKEGSASSDGMKVTNGSWQAERGVGGGGQGN